MSEPSVAPPAGDPIAGNVDRPNAADSGAGAGAVPNPDPGAPAPRPSTGEFDVLLRVTLALFVIGLAVWVVLSGAAYRRQYSGTGAAWHRGATNFIEITLVPEDRANLACASDVVMDGLHCAFGANRQPHRASSSAPSDDAQVLSPYVTVNGELFLGAGLWGSLLRRGALPTQRFTVFCDFEIAGALRSVALRWTPTGTFDPPTKSVAVGALRDCAIPR